MLIRVATRSGQGEESAENVRSVSGSVAGRPRTDMAADPRFGNPSKLEILFLVVGNVSTPLVD